MRVPVVGLHLQGHAASGPGGGGRGVQVGAGWRLVVGWCWVLSGDGGALMFGGCLKAMEVIWGLGAGQRREEGERRGRSGHLGLAPEVVFGG